MQTRVCTLVSTHTKVHHTLANASPLRSVFIHCCDEHRGPSSRNRQNLLELLYTQSAIPSNQEASFPPCLKGTAHDLILGSEDLDEAAGRPGAPKTPCAHMTEQKSAATCHPVHT